MKPLVDANHRDEEFCQRFLTACIDVELNMVIVGADPDSLIDRLVTLIPDDAVWSVNRGLSDGEIKVVLARFRERERGFLTINARTPEGAMDRLRLISEQKPLAEAVPIMLFEVEGYLSELLEITALELRPIFEIEDGKFRPTGLRPSFLDKLRLSIHFP